MQVERQRGRCDQRRDDVQHHGRDDEPSELRRAVARGEVDFLLKGENRIGGAEGIIRVARGGRRQTV
jgi:hypothetical protein